MAQTMRYLAVLTDFVPLEWHDLALRNEIRASVRIALHADRPPTVDRN